MASIRSYTPGTGMGFSLDSASLRWRIVLAGGAGAFLLLMTLAWVGSVAAFNFIAGEADRRLMDAVRRSTLLVDRQLVEREREVVLLARAPATADAARVGNERARSMGLHGRDIDYLERRFDDQRSLDVSPRLKRHLRAMLQPIDIAEIIVTDIEGLNIVTTNRTTDFVQRDELWWQLAMRNGFTIAEAAYDESARQTVISVARAIREEDADPPLGVVKVAFDLRQLDRSLAQASTIGGIQIDLIDAGGNVVSSSGNAPRMRPMDGASSLEAAGLDSIVTFLTGDVPRRAAVLFTNSGRWRLVAHMDAGETFARYQEVRGVLWSAALALGILVIAILLYVSRYLAQRVSEPASQLASVAEQVAAGDLSAEIGETATEDEIGRLTRATGMMIHDLRRLARAIRGSTHETAAMAGEITVGAEHIAGAAHEMAQTSADLSERAAEMAKTIQELAGSAGRLVTVSAELDAGAHEGVQRNSQLRALAADNRARLDETSGALQQLSSEVKANAEAIEALVHASDEVRNFVHFVRKMAKQSKLLALNAAMEAARAGEESQGFAVVAHEVRRLAASAAEAADRTEEIVGSVLEGVKQSRDASQRTVTTVAQVLESTRAGFQSFQEVENAVVENENWTSEIERAANICNDLVNEITERLHHLARGTDTFAAAMQQVAASSEEQSASTQQISAAAEKLAREARALTELAGTFRLRGGETPVPSGNGAPDDGSGGDGAPVGSGATSVALPA